MSADTNKQQEFVLRTLEERNIRFIRLWFTDVLGFLKSVAIAPAELENAFAEGIGFDGSAIEGFARVTESDMLAKPDPATFSILPWRTEAPGAARMFCDIAMPDGSSSPADPRNVLRRTLDKAAKMGYTVTPTLKLSSSYLRIHLKQVLHQFPSIKAATSITRQQRWDMTSAAKRLLCLKQWASVLSSHTTKVHQGNRKSIFDMQMH
jgi:hypothetical protein